MEWIADVAIPIVLGLVAAFGATWYSNKKNGEVRVREADDPAVDAIRTYIRGLRETADYFEAGAMAYEGWNPAKDVINPGGLDAVREASTYPHHIFTG